MLNPILTRDQSLDGSPQAPAEFQTNFIDQEINSLATKELLLNDKPRVFPIFEDRKISAFSATYSVYLEFFHSILLILGGLLVIMIAGNLVDLILISPYIQNNDLLQSITIPLCEALYENESQPEQDIERCEEVVEKAKSYLLFDYAHFVRFKYATLSTLIVIPILICLRNREEKRVVNSSLFSDLNLTQDLFSVLLEDIPLNVTQEELKIYLENQQPLKKSNGHVKEIILVQDYYKCLELSRKIQKLEKVINASSENQSVELSQEMRLPRNKNEGYQDQAKSSEVDKNIATLERILPETNHRSKVDQLSKLKDTLLQEKLTLSPHNGKAIVVFNSIHTKALVMKIFRSSICSFGEKIWLGSNQKTTLEESILTAKDLPDPQDLMPENLYYSPYKNVLRQLLVYIVALAVIFAGSLLAWAIEAWHAISTVQNTLQDTFNQFWNSSTNASNVFNVNFNYGTATELLLSFSVVLIESITSLIFKLLSKFVKYKSKSGPDLNFFYYTIFMSFVLYLIIQILPMAFSADGVESIIHTTTILLCVRYTAEKLAKAYIGWKKAKNYINKDYRKPIAKKGIGHLLVRLLLKLLINADIDNFQFQFFSEASRAFPMIAMNFAFTANGSVAAPTFLPSISTRSVIPLPMVTTIVALYIGAACDKYRLIVQRDDYTLKSTRRMLKVFEFLRYDQFAVWVGIIVWQWVLYYFTGYLIIVVKQTVSTTDLEIIDQFLASPSQSIDIYFIVGAFFYFVYLFAWPSNDSVKTQFSKKIANKKIAEYDQASFHFTAKYEKLNLNNFEEADKKEKNSIL